MCIRDSSNILKYPELGSPETATELLDALVEKKALNKLVGDTLESDDHHGIQVYIGDEAPVKLSLIHIWEVMILMRQWQRIWWKLLRRQMELI